MTHRKNTKQITRWALTFAAVIFLMAACASHSMNALGTEEPTAIIVDAETGKPVEGAIALAQWLRVSDKSGWFEGGRDELAKAKEVYADAEGKVNIDGFWGTYVMSRKPSLTVYKPGYLLWHSTNDGTGKSFCYPRQDFTQKNNTIRLYRFETDSAKWRQEHPDKKYPHLEQMSYFGNIASNLPCTGPNKFKLCDIFDENEMPFIRIEKAEKKACNQNTQ